VKDNGLKIQSSIIITMEQEVLNRPRRLTVYVLFSPLSSPSPELIIFQQKKRKRRKVDSDYLEKFKAQTEAISISLAMNQVIHGPSSSAPTLPPASIASGSSIAAPPVISAQPAAVAVDADLDAPSTKSITLTVRYLIIFFNSW
jgi:hypothetical protein